MPKLIDYPRTSYTGAWEVAEVVDDTGGKCALETCARKLNRKVSGSFKAIVGSAVKFGLLTSKRELLTTTTLFRRIKHAYDKQEELVFHREAFLTPPLFTQLCRKFRARELPVAMLDVLLIREFSVEEINAPNVAKAFVDGSRMVGLLDEHNVIADIDQLAAQQPPRRELASPIPTPNVFRQQPTPVIPTPETDQQTEDNDGEDTESDTSLNTPATTPEPTVAEKPLPPATTSRVTLPLPTSRPAPTGTADAIANLFGLGGTTAAPAASAASVIPPNPNTRSTAPTAPIAPKATQATNVVPPVSPPETEISEADILFRIQIVGPGINTELEVVDVDDLALVRGLLNKIERRLSKEN
jgi:hypothetical protein